MSHLPEQPAAWASRYIGIPFKDGGRDRDGCDCWGLVRLVYAERHGILLPHHDGRYSSTRDVEALEAVRTSELASEAWRPASEDEAAVGDVMLFELGQLWHVGIIVGRGLVLHVMRGVEACVERIDTPAWMCRSRGIYRYNAGLQVITRRMPFGAQPIRSEIAAGLTLQNIVGLVASLSDPNIRAFINDVEVPRSSWHLVRPRPGRRVLVSAVPRGGGGGKDVVRVVAALAIVAAAAAAGGPLAGALGYAKGTTAFGIASAVISGAVAIGGTLAMNALIPPRQGGLDLGLGSEKTSPTLLGSRNDIRRYAVRPCVHGSYVFAPPMAGVPYSEVVGDDTYLRMLFFAGRNGPIDISELRIGATSLTNYDGVEVEVRTGAAGEQPISLYTKTVHEESLSVLLEQAGGWTVRTTDPGAREISVDVTFAQGLVAFDSAGNRSDRTVEVEIEYSVAGANDWKTINGDGGAAGSPEDYRGLDLLMRTPEATFGGSGVHSNDLNWSATQVPYPDAKPAYLPAAGFCWVASGWIYIPVTGSYQFCVDGSDACDVHVDWIGVATFYGSHSTEVTQATLNSTTRAGSPVTLTKGFHQFRARVEHRSASASGAALAVGWKKPGDSAFTIIPQSQFARTATGADAGSLDYSWWTFGSYDSSIVTTEARTDQIRRSRTWAVEEGPYDVRLRRITADTTDPKISDKVYWTALRSIEPEPPVTDDGSAYIALRIKASDQLNGLVDQFNCRVRNLVQDWDSATQTWILRASSNPASQFRAALQGRGTRKPIPDSKLNLEELAAWHEACAAKGLEFNAVIDFAGTLWERLQDIAAAGRAVPAIRDGKWTVVRDVAQSVPRQLFTPRNSWGFRARKAFPDQTHALRVQFRDRANNYEQAERVVLADGYQLGGYDAWGNYHPEYPEATVFETLDLFGVDTGAQAFLHGRYHLAVMAQRPEIYELNVDIEHLVCTRGDMVMVTHDVPMFGTGYGRVKDLTFSGSGALTHVILDEPVTMDAEQDWGLLVRQSDGGKFLARVVSIDGRTDTVELQTPVASGGSMPRAGDLFGFGPLGQETREMIVRSIEPDSAMNARLILLDHAPTIQDADDGVIPPYDPGITIEPDYSAAPEDPVIESIRSDDYVMVRDPDGSLRQRMLITLRKPSGTKPIPSLAQVKLRPKPASGNPQGNWITLAPVPLTSNQVSVLEVDAGVTYQVQLRVLTALGLASNWVATEHAVAGKNLPPPDVVSFSAERLGDGTRRFRWDLGNEPPDVAGVLIRYGEPGVPWPGLQPLQTASIEGASPFDTPRPPTSGLKRYAIKMVDTSGNESVNAVYVEKDLGYPPQEDVALSQDHRADVWPDEREDCFLSTGNILEAADPTTWDEWTTWDEEQRWNQVADLPADSTTWAELADWDSWTTWGLAPGRPLRYTTDALDAGIAFQFEPFAYVLADGLVAVEVAYSATSATPTNWTAIDDLAGTTVLARYMRFRVTVTVTANQPVPVLRELVVMMRAPIITREFNDLDTATVAAIYRIGDGDIRIPVPVGLFTQIRRVSLSFNGAGVGRTFEVIDKSVSQGPRVKLYDTDGQLADGVVDVVVRGI